MKASTGLLTQFLSAAAVNAGTGGTARFRNAHCFRSISVYLPGGAIESDAKASETSATTGTKRLIIFPPEIGIPELYASARRRSTGIPQRHKGWAILYECNLQFAIPARRSWTDPGSH